MREDDNIEIYEGQCHYCKHESLLIRPCYEPYCDDGFIDEYEDDPINYSPGESFMECQECHGKGFIVWCSDCGREVIKGI